MTIRGPLTGVRIADLSQVHAGPYGSQMLGDLGAEIIKVETPMGDLLRGTGYYLRSLNRNKKGIVLDLTTSTGKEALTDLVKVSDVILDNFRVGVMKRLGFDHEAVSKINSRIISASITGYGSSGPYAGAPSYDDIAQAIGGMAGLCGDPGGQPMRSAAALADVGAGIFCTYGIVTALYQRERTGRGSRVEVNLLDTVMALLANMFGFYFFYGQVPPPQGSRHTLIPLLGYYKARDGYVAIGPSWPRICRTINREWMIDDPRFSASERNKHKQEMDNLIEEALQAANVADWVNLLRADDIACGPVNTLDKVLEEPQVIHNRAAIEMEHPEYGKMKAIDCPIKMPGSIEGENTPPPNLGEHTEEVLKQVLNYSDEKIAALMKEQEENSEKAKARIRRMG